MVTALSVLCVVASVLLVGLVLAHRGTGGGISDMLGGGGSSLNSSATANRNLTRLTLAVVAVWVASVIGLGLLGP